MVQCCLLFHKGTADFCELNRWSELCTLELSYFSPLAFLFPSPFWHFSFPGSEVGVAAAAWGDSLARAQGGSSSRPGSVLAGRHMEKHRASLRCLGRNGRLKCSSAAFRGSKAS